MNRDHMCCRQIRPLTCLWELDYKVNIKLFIIYWFVKTSSQF